MVEKKNLLFRGTVDARKPVLLGSARDFKKRGWRSYNAFVYLNSGFLSIFDYKIFQSGSNVYIRFENNSNYERNKGKTFYAKFYYDLSSGFIVNEKNSVSTFLSNLRENIELESFNG